MLVTRRCNCFYGLVSLGQSIFCFSEGVLDQAVSEICSAWRGKIIFQWRQKTYLPFGGQFLKALIARLFGVASKPLFQLLHGIHQIVSSTFWLCWYSCETEVNVYVHLDYVDTFVIKRALFLISLNLHTYFFFVCTKIEIVSCSYWYFLRAQNFNRCCHIGWVGTIGTWIRNLDAEWFFLLTFSHLR